MKLRCCARVLCALLLSLGLAIPAGAQVSKVFTYQGRLSDNNVPAVGTFDFEIRLYDAQTAGNLLLTVSKPGIQVVDGVFSTEIDFSAAPTLFDDSSVWAQVSVNNAGQVVQTLSPRTQVTPAPQATYAVKAGTLLNSLPTFAGLSTTPFSGGAGFFAFLGACQTDFPGSRVCTSKDIISLTAVPVVASPAWIQPIQTLTTTSTGVSVSNDIYSGVRVSIPSTISLSCNGWTDGGGGTFGLAIVSSGFTTFACGNIFKVACCTGPSP